MALLVHNHRKYLKFINFVFGKYVNNFIFNYIIFQVLKLVDDYRNHPASLFFAANIPLVVSSDDYSFWETLPLSHDFYQAFLGIASSHSDLRTLKKLATNSIKYSSMSDSEKKRALKMWQPKWNQFIEDVIVDFI